jgi:hypothetical protein
MKILPKYFGSLVTKCNIFLAATEEVRDAWFDVYISFVYIFLFF